MSPRSAGHGEDGGERLVLRFGGHVAVGCQMREKRFDFGLSHVGRMSPRSAVTMETKELDNPVSIRLFRCQGVVQRAHLVVKPVQQFFAAAIRIWLCIAGNQLTSAAQRRLCDWLKSREIGGKMLPRLDFHQQLHDRHGY